MTQENFRKLFPDIGKSFRKSLWVMTRFWGIYFSWVSTHEIYLEIVSGKFSESRPKIAKSGKSFRDIPWVTVRFLEIVSGICLYGLTRQAIVNFHFSITHYGVVNLSDSVFIIGGNCDTDYSSQVSKVSFFQRSLRSSTDSVFSVHCSKR